MFTVAYFQDTNEIEVVPTKWFGPGPTTCKFPDKHVLKTGTMAAAIKHCVDATTEWPVYENVVAVKKFDEYEKARKKLKKLADAKKVDIKFDLDTTDVEFSRRKRSAPSRFSETESDGEEPVRRKRKTVAAPALPPLPCPVPRISSPVPTPFQHSSPISLPLQEAPEVRFPSTPTADMAKMYSLLVKMNMQLTSTRMLIERLSTKQLGGLDQGDPDEIAKFILPGRNLNDIQTTESLLEDAEKGKHLVSYLSTFGGNSTKDIVSRIMSKVMSDSVAMGYNWSGKRGSKKAFSKLRLSTVVQDACKRNGVQEASSEDAIKVWLKNAGDRSGGRKRREDKRREKDLRMAALEREIRESISSSEDDHQF